MSWEKRQLAIFTVRLIKLSWEGKRCYWKWQIHIVCCVCCLLLQISVPPKCSRLKLQKFITLWFCELGGWLLLASLELPHGTVFNWWTAWGLCLADTSGMTSTFSPCTLISKRLDRASLRSLGFPSVRGHSYKVSWVLGSRTCTTSLTWHFICQNKLQDQPTDDAKYCGIFCDAKYAAKYCGHIFSPSNQLINCWHFVVKISWELTSSIWIKIHLPAYDVIFLNLSLGVL